MKRIECEMCGSTDLIKDEGLFVCQCCGCKYTVEEAKKLMVEGAVEVTGTVQVKAADFIIESGELIEYHGESKNVVIPDNVSSIAETAFKGKGIEEVVVPGSVAEIAPKSFAQTSSLRCATLLEGVQRIGEGAFFKSGLQEIVIPDGVTSIGGSAFECCKNLKAVVFPDSVRAIGDSAFYGCSSLESVLLSGEVQSIQRSAFGDCPSLVKLSFPTQMLTNGFKDTYGFDVKCLFDGGSTAPCANEIIEKARECERPIRREKGVCQHCGGSFKGAFGKKCSICGKPKDY